MLAQQHRRTTFSASAGLAPRAFYSFLVKLGDEGADRDSSRVRASADTEDAEAWNGHAAAPPLAAGPPAPHTLLYFVPLLLLHLFRAGLGPSRNGWPTNEGGFHGQENQTSDR